MEVIPETLADPGGDVLRVQRESRVKQFPVRDLSLGLAAAERRERHFVKALCNLGCGGIPCRLALRYTGGEPLLASL